MLPRHFQNLNHHKFDFWKVYESIRRFYPIGTMKEESGLFYSYPGIKELQSIVIDNIHDNEHFEERWENFTKEIETEIGKEIVGTTYGQAPSFSSFVLLEKRSLDNLTRTKQLHFFVSLLGPYYTIIGEDTNMVIHKELHFRSTNYLVVSPEDEYADTFRLLCDKIEYRFTGYRFLPFELCRSIIDGLDVPYSDDNLNTVFHALFNNLIDLTTWKIIGNTFYKSDDWIKDGYVDEGGGWKAYPPTNR